MRHFLLLIGLMALQGISAQDKAPTPLEKAVTEGKVQWLNADNPKATGAILSVNELSDLDKEVIEYLRENKEMTYLVKVTSGKATRIHEEFFSGDNIYIINPAGILVGPKAVIHRETNASGSQFLLPPPAMIVPSAAEVPEVSFPKGSRIILKADGTANLVSPSPPPSKAETSGALPPFRLDLTPHGDSLDSD